MMFDFYKKALLSILAALLITSAWGLFCYERFELAHKILPLNESYFPWSLVALTDQTKGGHSTLSVNEASQYIDYTYFLSDAQKYPHATAVIAFDRLENAENLIDLSKYSKIVFTLKCTPSNILSIHLHSFDSFATDPANFSSYRISEALRSCDQEWTQVEIDLHHLHVPSWWQDLFAIKNSDQQYQLNKVLAVSLGASKQGPINSKANVSISNAYFLGRDWRFIWLFAFVTVMLWLAAIFWLLKIYTQCLTHELENRVSKSRPLVAHKLLSLEPQKENSAFATIMRFIATEYSDPNMSLEKASSTLGINRTKLNEKLKSELGLTFNTYLNKLRLVEAARILEEGNDTIIAEIAYSVGYNNVTYFNKLFKSEYGCNPKKFKEIYQKGSPV